MPEHDAPARAAGHQLHRLHRSDGRVLSVARLAPHRAVRPQPQGLLERSAARAIDAGRQGERPARVAPGRRLQHDPRRQVHERLHAGDRRSGRRRSRLGRLADHPQRRPLLQLRPVGERPPSPLRQRATRTTSPGCSPARGSKPSASYAPQSKPFYLQLDQRAPHVGRRQSPGPVHRRAQIAHGRAGPEGHRRCSADATLPPAAVVQRAGHERQAAVPAAAAAARLQHDGEQSRRGGIAHWRRWPGSTAASARSTTRWRMPASSARRCSSSSPTTASSTASIGSRAARCCRTRRRCASRS